MKYIENKTFDEIQVGDMANLSRTLTREDIELFAIMSGDVNPAHVDPEYAKQDMFHEIIAHGMWGGALISTILGTKLPGPGTIYLGQTLKFVSPVTIGDTINVSVRVASKRDDKKILTLECRCTNQNGKEVISGEATVIAPSTKIKVKRVALPQFEIKPDEHNSLSHQIIALTNGMKPLDTAVVQPIDENSLGGAVEAAADGLMNPILIGEKDKILKAATQMGVDIKPYRIIETEDDNDAVQKAIELVKKGEAEAIMKGKLHTDSLMSPVLDKEHGLRTNRRMSHVFILDIPSYHKLLFLTDAAININPTLSDKKDIVQNAIDLFHGIGLGTPKVAIISATETVNEKMQVTLDATALCKMADRGQITGGILDGPLAFDNAVSKEAAKAKGIVSHVAGDADIIVVPEIETGNALYKQTRFLFQIDGAGIALGAKVPIILTSRAAGPGITRKFSCAVALLYVRNKQIRPSTSSSV